MSGATRALQHPALEPSAGEALFAAALSDRARLAVVLQAAGLLSLCEVAGWRLARGFDGARLDGAGRLCGLAAEPGAGGSALALLRELLLRLFHGDGDVAGRGAARRAARELAARWAAGGEAIGADRAVADLLSAAPFLAGPAFAPARAALAGRIVRDDGVVEWRAGRSAAREAAATVAEPSAAEPDLAALVAAGRWREAARLGRERPELGARQPTAFARALWGVGRLESALFVLEGRSDAASESLRAECRLALGELGGARESVRRLERLELSAEELVAAGDVVLRVLALARESDAARDWAARAAAKARGALRAPARLLAPLAAIDRGDLETAARLLGVGDSDRDADGADDETEVRLQLALARGDAERALPLARARLAGRRRMPLLTAGRAWSNLGFARSLARDFAGAERAYAHARRLLHGADGPLALTLAGANLADVRLRLGKLRGVDAILDGSTAWNRRSGNLLGELEDELLRVRLELVRGELAAAVERCRRGRERARAAAADGIGRRLAVMEARALGWLGRPAEARAALEAAGEAARGELEPEEVPFLLALAGDADSAAAAAEGSGFAALAAPLARGDAPPRERWRALDELEPYRRARFALDAELAAPGAAPRELRAEAAEIFRRLGAETARAVCERGETVAWRALGRFFERPSGERAAIEELLAAVGHAEAELLLRTPEGERRLAGAGGRPLAAERSAPLGGGTDGEGDGGQGGNGGGAELVLRSGEIDEPLRALFALFLRDLPTGEAPAGPLSTSLAGESPALRAAVERLHRFASSELPVLILGENGTGKELAAAEVHRRSARRKGPWVPVNCAGLSETLLLSELFGHVRGAFTGADQPRAGVFEAARGGTVFLDEIGDLPLPAQGSLLRVLQEGEIRRLGESMPRKVDARVVAATNRDLESMVEQGRFRQDLYYRLKVATVLLPPLRERGQDALLLAERFLEGLRARRPGLRLTPEARRALAAHAWPGNVRELKNALEAAAALADDGRIGPEHLDLDSRKALAAEGREGDYHRRVEAYRRRLIESALESSEGSLAAAARQLGVTRQFLSQFVRKYGLEVRR